MTKGQAFALCSFILWSGVLQQATKPSVLWASGLVAFGLMMWVVFESPSKKP